MEPADRKGCWWIRAIRLVVGGPLFLIGLVITLRVAQIGLGGWDEARTDEIWQLRCYTGMVIFPLAAVLGAGASIFDRYGGTRGRVPRHSQTVSKRDRGVRPVADHPPCGNRHTFPGRLASVGRSRGDNAGVLPGRGVSRVARTR